MGFYSPAGSTQFVIAPRPDRNWEALVDEQTFLSWEARADQEFFAAVDNHDVKINVSS